MLRIFCTLLFLCSSVLLASDQENVLTLPQGNADAIIHKQPMPELGDNRIGEILYRYYHKGLGGPDTWKKITSLRYLGELKTDNEVLNLKVYQKKPNLIKMVFFEESEQNALTVAYDGEIVWERRGSQAEPREVTGDVARRFIHGTQFSNYLLYPYASGKRISLVDTLPVDGSICHQVRVQLDTGYQVDYFIDIHSYLVTKMVNTDLRNNTVGSIVFKDFLMDFDFPIASKVESYEEGEWVSLLVIDELQVNSGIMSWMFRMPN